MNDADEATSPDLRVKKPRGIVAGKFSSESLTNTFHISRFTRSRCLKFQLSSTLISY